MTPQTSTPRRLQGTYVTDEEIKKVVSFLKDACPDAPDYNDEIVSKTTGSTSFDFNGGTGSNHDDQDELYLEAKEEVIKSGKASASYLQRRLGVGYARAARMIDMLEEAGIVGGANGAKPRDILVDKSALNQARSASLPAEVFDEPEPEEEEPEEEEPEEEESNIEEVNQEELSSAPKRNRGDDELY